MQRHHEMALSTALDELFLEGSTSIRWDHLYLWFDATRLNKGPYREIIRLWEELCIQQQYSKVPEIKVVNWDGKPTLTLVRDAFEDEPDQVPLHTWA